MDDRPDLDLGPDPHLNGRGVALTREQRRVLAVVAAVIGLLLVLALVGLVQAFPSAVVPSDGGAVASDAAR